MLKGLKDGALSIGLRKLVNEKFGEYGEVQDCDIDTGKNRLVLRALLRGESAPITAIIDRYEIERSGDDVYIVLHKLSASREWLTQLLRRIGEGKRYKIPPAVAALL